MPPRSPCPVGGRVSRGERTSASWSVELSSHKELNVANVFASLFHAKLPPVVAVRREVGLNILCRQWLYCTHGNTIVILCGFK